MHQARQNSVQSDKSSICVSGAGRVIHLAGIYDEDLENNRCIYHHHHWGKWLFPWLLTLLIISPRVTL